MSHAASHTRFLRLLLGAVGATTACTGALAGTGCGGKVVVDVATTGSGGTAGSDPTGGAGGVFTTTISAGGALTTSVSVSVSTGTGGTLDCNQFLAQVTSPDPASTCAGPNVFDVNVACFKQPPPPATCATAFSNDCILSTYSCGLQQFGDSIACGPLPKADGTCCYVITGDCPVGRPFTIDGKARLGALSRGDDWRVALAPDTTMDATTRAALADAWGREALFEHASIASFARFVLQLLALGAPADLVADAQRALMDEHDHARTCLGLASAYAGVALRPGPLAVDDALADCADPVAIAASLCREGCVAETIAALQAEHAHAEARDPVVKAALGRIAEQESAHAVLAWRALRWMIDAGRPEVRAAVARVFAEAEVHVSIGALTDLEGDVETMRAHGYLPIEERRALAREALGRVVGPAATALLASNGVVRSHATGADRAHVC
ncbi:Hypothetical protein A7982_09406 [Minicystis rosea]|nr:Hypothetical protein A7982_09406 [Minicystis rosea]